MEHKIPLDGENIYFYFRRKAAAENPALTSRESTSELLDISFDCLKAYESGKTSVPEKVVLKMCELYHSPELRNFHCRYECPIGEKYASTIDISSFSIDRLTLKLLNSLRSISTIKDSLIDIVADGKVTDDERPAFDDILQALDAISLHTQELRLWVEKNKNNESISS